MKAHSKSLPGFQLFRPIASGGGGPSMPFCRYVDDLVDEAKGPTSAILAE